MQIEAPQLKMRFAVQLMFSFFAGTVRRVLRTALSVQQIIFAPVIHPALSSLDSHVLYLRFHGSHILIVFTCCVLGPRDLGSGQTTNGRGLPQSTAALR